MKLETNELKTLLGTVKSEKFKKYDCIVPISGGKDGTFILWYLKKYTNLNILAFHIDIWFNSEVAMKNVTKITKDVGCDLEIYRPRWDLMKSIYKKLLLQMGEICISCEMMIQLFTMNIAVEKNIPFVVWGLTPNQMKVKNMESGDVKIDLKYYQRILNYYKQLVTSTFNDNPKDGELFINTIMENPNINENSNFPRYIYPFFYLGYDASLIEDTIAKELGWKRAQDVGGTSSNCIINQLHIYLKKQYKGIDYYKKIIEKKRNDGEATPEVFSRAYEKHADKDLMEKILKDLEITLTPDEIVNNVNNFKKDIYLRYESNISQ